MPMNDRPHLSEVRLLPWRVPWWLIDGLLVGALMIGTIARPHADQPGHDGVEWLGFAAATVLLPARRRYPIPTLIAAVTAMTIAISVADRPSLLMPVVLIAVYNVAVRYQRRVAFMAGGLTTLVLLVLVIVRLENEALNGAALGAIAWPAFAVAAGIGVRTSRENLAAVHERARRAEQQRQLEAHRQVIEERLRIARDVHDLVAHHIAVVNVQAGVAGHLLRSNPEGAEAALDTTRQAAATVIDELGELLSVLRAPDDDDPIAPTPDLAAVGDLIASFAASGLKVEYRTAGAPRAMTASAQLSAYRVVQEALTNAHKYGDGTAVVNQTFGDDGLDVTVSNPLRAVETSGSSFGLIGMGERVEAVGGTLEITPDDAGCFVVRAVLPVGDVL